ncbi:hypothetical protein [Paraburkholderia dipogonis]|uniref:hypothetical protein n=1 Tax=Paraburkholderia dipogonis TaxID=1211383 RepID=UPI0038B6DDFB
MEYLSAFLASLPDFSKLLPATTLVAILIFLVKEYLEARRRTAADKRKVRALKKVLGRECQLNYSAIDRLRDTLAAIQEFGVAEDASRLSISESPAGGYVFMITDRDGSGRGGVLVGIQRDSLLKHLVEIAALDEMFYSKCEFVLDGLSEADHVYQSLVHGPEKHFPSTPEHYYEGVVDYGLRELNDSIAALKELYLVCTGSVLRQGKLR